MKQRNRETTIIYSIGPNVELRSYVHVSQTKCNYYDVRLKGNHIISFACIGASTYFVSFVECVRVCFFFQMKLRLYLFKTHYQLASHRPNRMRCDCTWIKRLKMPQHNYNSSNDQRIEGKKYVIPHQMHTSIMNHTPNDKWKEHTTYSNFHRIMHWKFSLDNFNACDHFWWSLKWHEFKWNGLTFSLLQRFLIFNMLFAFWLQNCSQIVHCPLSNVECIRNSNFVLAIFFYACVCVSVCMSVVFLNENTRQL